MPIILLLIIIILILLGVSLKKMFKIIFFTCAAMFAIGLIIYMADESEPKDRSIIKCNQVAALSSDGMLFCLKGDSK